MDDIAQQLHEHVEELLSHVSQVQQHLTARAVPVSRQLRDSFAHFHQNYGLFAAVAESNDIDAISQHAANVGIFGRQLSQLLAKMPDLDDELRSHATAMGEIAAKVRHKAQDDPSTFRPLGDSPAPRPAAPTALPPAVLKRIEQFMLDQEKQDERVKRSLTENERFAAVLRNQVEELEKQVSEVLSKVNATYDQTLTELQSKKDQIDALLGHASGRVIAGDYERSAATEKVTADWLRYASLVGMALIVAVLGYAFWETTNADFHWQKSLFRVALAFLLSAPAAYLARESSKHRVQQYQHHQTSLDLKAIAPYLASLPEDLQHKIKSEAATKLFAGRDVSNPAAPDSYPVNTQELLMELVKKLELPKSGGGDKG